MRSSLSILTATVAALRLLERSLDHSLQDRWGKFRTYIGAEERVEVLERILNSWTELCGYLDSQRESIWRAFLAVLLRRILPRGRAELIPPAEARSALRAFRDALALSARDERPPNEEIVQMRMRLYDAQKMLCRFSGARWIYRATRPIEHFNEPLWVRSGITRRPLHSFGIGGEAFKPSYAWGQVMKIKADAPPRLRPGELAEIRGVREIKTLEEELLIGSPVGSRVFLVAFRDDETVEISREWLEWG